MGSLNKLVKSGIKDAEIKEDNLATGVATTAKFDLFFQFEGFGCESAMRGTVRKCGSSRWATKWPLSENRSFALKDLRSSSCSVSFLHAQRKKWKMP